MSVKKNASDSSIQCRLCGNLCHAEFTTTFLQHYRIACYQCRSCGLLQTEKPYWLDEAYGKAIASLDTGIMVRNLYLMRIVAILLRVFRICHGVFLDYGAGHGIFTRLMRDHGYDFRWRDPYAENLYAYGFEYEEDVPVIGVTAFEVLEHLENPKFFFDEVLGRMKPRLFLSMTEIFSEPVDPEWHYLYPDSGQHIAFFQEKTLNYVAKQYGYHCVSYRNFHLFAIAPFSRLLLKSIIRFAGVIYPFMKFGSLQAKDQQHVLDNLQKQSQQ